ncbi:PRC and DUF2382 domain-containing protein [Nigerium massiliense]|uniref:PRC and DUF2382 domain-containing protein n=1 Tax=Nigerium massiliense TaxID=1522317 RepID=UPI000693F307|nr:PRC and DUF2382 domain-containing protein [Nigerium massiliense]
MFSENDIKNLQAATAYCKDGNKIGSVGEVYLDDQSGQPEWVTVNTGLFGAKTNFVPLEGATLEGDRLNVAYGKDVVTDAPKVDEDGHLSEEEEAELYRYYNRDYSATDRRDAVSDVDRDRNAAAGTAGVGAAGLVGDRDADRDRADVDRDLAVDRDRVENVRERDDRDRVGDDADVTLSEERLNVGTESHEAGRARLRKYTTTEEQTVTVPVQKERLVVEREPVNEVSNGHIGDGDTDETITLREERPVVNTETVDVERVHVGKETVTENETVSGTVRKEHVDIEGDGVADQGRDVTDRRDDDRDLNR